jgi:hypothetical protein
MAHRRFFFCAFYGFSAVVLVGASLSGIDPDERLDGTDFMSSQSQPMTSRRIR